jgi:hypothetical protein
MCIEMHIPSKKRKKEMNWRKLKEREKDIEDTSNL